MKRIASKFGFIIVCAAIMVASYHLFSMLDKPAGHTVTVTSPSVSVQAQQFEQRNAQLNHELSVYRSKGCEQTSDYLKAHKGTYPRTMVVQLTDGSKPTWTLVRKAWSFKNVGGYTLMLCK